MRTRENRRILALVGLTAMVASCAALSFAAESAERLQLRVGVSPDYPPIAFKEGAELSGVEIDLARRLEADFGVEVTFVETKFADLIEALKKRRIDVIMSGMSITVDRRTDVDFTDPYQRVGQMALVRKADRVRFSAPGTMNAAAVRVGVAKQTTGEMYARQQLDKATIQAFDSPEQGIDALRSGGLDFFIHDAPTVWRTIGRPKHEDPDLAGIYRPLTEEHLAWAVRQEDAELKGFLNAAVAHWHKTGTIESILDRWIPVRKVAVEVP
jgi:polar amino acid transport system substrate-binding protein